MPFHLISKRYSAESNGWPRSASSVRSCRPPTWRFPRRRLSGWFLLRLTWVRNCFRLQSLSHAALEGVHQLQYWNFFRDGRRQRSSFQLGLDQGSELLGGIVAIVRPWDGFGGGVDEQTRQMLFFRGNLLWLGQGRQGFRRAQLFRVMQNVQGQELSAGPNQGQD